MTACFRSPAVRFKSPAARDDTLGAESILEEERKDPKLLDGTEDADNQVSRIPATHAYPGG